MRVLLLVVLVLWVVACTEPEKGIHPSEMTEVGSTETEHTGCRVVASGLRRVAPDTLAARESLLTIAPARADSQHVHVVVEIPAGTSYKWEVTKPGGRLALERSQGQVRRIRYLPYPANYGIIPQTLSDATVGGDGDPLDVVLLGDATPCGALHRARVVGVLRLIDDGARDDKILAVANGSVFDGVADVDGLRADFPGVVEILETWFTRYEGAGNRSDGVAGAAEANAIVDDAIEAFATTRSTDEDGA